MSQRKRLKRDNTSFEQLPNELFIEIFRYLNGVDTIYAFLQLNTRFQCLLNSYVNIFNFKSVSKAKFEFVTQQHDVHKWRSLCLSNDDETPGQIKLFCQLFPLNEYISQLQSLSVLNMKLQYSQEFLLQPISFNHLVSLSIGKICGENISSIKLPSLKRLVIISCKHITGITNFHCLESLEYTVHYECHRDYILTLPTTLKQLKIFYEEEMDGHALRTSLRQIPKLTKLSLYDNGICSAFPNGQIWEGLIQSSLPLLKTFQFYFAFYYSPPTFNGIEELIASFSTPFYLIEKRWFIRFDSDFSIRLKGVLYSLPFSFSQMSIDVCSFDRSISTLTDSGFDELMSNSYAKIKTLVLNEKCPIPDPGLFKSNIEQLIMNNSLTTNWLPLLTELRHLTVGYYVNMSPTEFTHLLLNTPQLRSLTISSEKLMKWTANFRNKIICEQLSQKIRSLVISSNWFNGYTIDIVRVRMLSSIARIFGTRCEHLSLRLSGSPAIVCPILRRMQQLRSLHIQCTSSSYTPKEKDFSTCWLRKRSTDTLSDFMYNSDQNDFYVWFGNRL